MFAACSGTLHEVVGLDTMSTFNCRERSHDDVSDEADDARRKMRRRDDDTSPPNRWAAAGTMPGY